jgi:hypothetical protein
VVLHITPMLEAPGRLQIPKEETPARKPVVVTNIVHRRSDDEHISLNARWA